MFTDTFEHIRFYFLVLLFPSLFSFFCSVREIKLTNVIFRAHVKISPDVVSCLVRIVFSGLVCCILTTCWAFVGAECLPWRPVRQMPLILVLFTVHSLSEIKLRELKKITDDGSRQNNAISHVRLFTL